MIRIASFLDRPCMKKREVKKPIRRTMSISSIVLDWCKEMVKDYVSRSLYCKPILQECLQMHRRLLNGLLSHPTVVTH